MIGDEIHDLAHSRLDDVREILHADLLGWHSTQPGDRDICIRLRLVSERASELDLHLFGLGLQYAETRLDIICNILTGEGDHRRVFQNSLIENCEVGRASTNVDDGDTGLEIFLPHYGR